MTLDLDQPGAVRPGEELDLGRLQAYLEPHLGSLAAPLELRQFPHGHSNLTYLVRSGEREWVLRRPPVGNPVRSAHDMGREYRVLSRLTAVYPPAPKPLAYCDDPAVLGAPFYLMERRRGVILRGGAKAALEPALLRRLCEALIDGLAELHALDYKAAGLAELGKPEGYVERQVRGWSERYRNAQTDALPAVDQTAAWLEANRPADRGAALIHNDYKFDNLLLDPADLCHIVAVLDWEMCTLGDPLMDLGTTLAYWVEPADPVCLKHLMVGPTDQPGSLTRLELAARYFKQTGRVPVNMLFYYVFGLFKVAVIVQQIYARYVRGHTSDPRFGKLSVVVSGLGEAAARSIDAATI